MRLVIQCAGSKREGGFLRAPDGRSIKFVAHPELASTAEQAAHFLARPDDIATGSQTWRDLVVDYNAVSVTGGNLSGLWRASRLYEPPVYERLITKFGADSVYILSAGWGLIRATFLTPNYDITFSSQAEGMKRRRRGDRFQDFIQLDTGSTDPIVFLGGKDYLPLFCWLTIRSQAARLIYFNSSTPPYAPGCRVEKFETSARTNWHYLCAEKLIAGTLVGPVLTPRSSSPSSDSTCCSSALLAWPSNSRLLARCSTVSCCSTSICQPAKLTRRAFKSAMV